MCKARDFYFSNTLSYFIRSEPQIFFQYLSDTKRSVQQLKIDDALIVNDTEIGQSFNRYFQSVLSQSDKISLSTDFLGFLDEDFISIQGVFNMLLNLKPKSSSGPDKIPNAFLIHSAESLSRFLIVLFRNSFSNSCLPLDWRSSRVVPIFKKCDRLCVSN